MNAEKGRDRNTNCPRDVPGYPPLLCLSGTGADAIVSATGAVAEAQVGRSDPELSCKDSVRGCGKSVVVNRHAIFRFTGKNRERSEKWPVFGCFQPEFLRVFNALSENKLVQEQGKSQPTTGKRGSGNRQPAMPARDSLRLRIGSAKRRHRGTFLLPPDRGLRPPAPAYSSKRLASSRSWPYRLASGNGGSQASRRTIQLS